ITGTGLTGTTAIAFGAIPATSFTVNSDSQITATVPAASAGAVTVSVTAPGGTGSVTDGYTYVAPPPPPAVTTPANGQYTRDSSPTLTGTSEPNATITVTLNSVTPATTVADGSGAWSVTLPFQADGD